MTELAVLCKNSKTRYEITYQAPVLILQLQSLSICWLCDPTIPKNGSNWPAQIVQLIQHKVCAVPSGLDGLDKLDWFLFLWLTAWLMCCVLSPYFSFPVVIGLKLLQFFVFCFVLFFSQELQRLLRCKKHAQLYAC